MLLLLLIGIGVSQPLQPTQGGGTSGHRKKKNVEPIWLRRIKSEQEPKQTEPEIIEARREFAGNALVQEIEHLRDAVSAIPPLEPIARLRVTDDGDYIEALVDGDTSVSGEIADADDAIVAKASRNDDDIALAALLDAAISDEEMVAEIIDEIRKHAELQYVLQRAGLTIEDLKRHFAMQDAGLSDAVDRSTVNEHEDFWGRKSKAEVQR